MIKNWHWTQFEYICDKLCECCILPSAWRPGVNWFAKKFALTCVIDYHGLPKYCRRELGVCKFGIEVKFKVGIIVNFLITKYDNLTSLWPFYILLKNVVNNWINIFIHILEKEGETILNG